MADATMMVGELSDDQKMEITDDESSSKISGLSEKIADLEKQREERILKKEAYLKEIEELKALMEELHNENVELKNQCFKALSENQTLQFTAARAADLEIELARLNHDWVDAEGNLHDTNFELAGAEVNLENMKERDKEKGVKLEVVRKERNLLLSRVEKLEGVVSGLREKLEGMEKEKLRLKKNVQELEAAVEGNKRLEKGKDELVKKVEEMKGQIGALKRSLEEKEKVISGLEEKEEVTVDEVVRDVQRDGEIRGSKKKNIWAVIGGSSIVAIAVMGVVRCVHAARKF